MASLVEFEPAPGVKVSRIVNLADDMTMALRAASVRILAPIPGKPVVGVEVSNPRRETVYIRDLLNSDSYRSSDSKLTLAVGKDTTGNVVVMKMDPTTGVPSAIGSPVSVPSPEYVGLVYLDPQ